MLEHRGYRLSTTLDENAAKQLLDDLIEKSYTVKQTFKDSRSTYAAHLQLGKNNIVHKIPRARLRRPWEKLITLIRDCESIRTFNNLLLMDQLGFHAPNPLLAGEKRKRGFVTDSFCCYRFEKGHPAGPDDARRVVLELLKLHDKGYLRTDAKAANFLITEDTVTFIDFRLTKPVLFPKLNKEMELARLARVYPESLPHIPKKVCNSPSFKFATWLELKKIKIKTIRRRIRSCLKLR